MLKHCELVPWWTPYGKHSINRRHSSTCFLTVTRNGHKLRMIWIRGSITFWFWQNYFAMSFFTYLIQVWLHNSGPWSIYNYSKCFIRSWRFKYNLTFVTCMYRYVILPTLIRLNDVTYCASSHSRLRFHAQTTQHKMCALRDSTVHGANMGPIWGRQDPGGPHVGPMDFVFWACLGLYCICKLHDHHATIYMYTSCCTPSSIVVGSYTGCL